eukprot:3786308-Rhodomonas_salina.1
MRRRVAVGDRATTTARSSCGSTTTTTRVLLLVLLLVVGFRNLAKKLEENFVPGDRVFRSQLAA